eukprot:210483_1
MIGRKFYFHLEAGDPVDCFLIRWNGSDPVTIRDALLEFSERYNDKHSTTRTINERNLQLSTVPNPKPSQFLASNATIATLSDRQDVFVHVSKGSPDDDIVLGKAPSLAPSKEAVAQSATSEVAEMDVDSEDNVVAIIKDAKALIAKKKNRQAQVVLREALELSKDNPICLELLGSIDLENGFFEEALVSFHAALSRSDSTRRRKLFELVAETYFRLGEFSESVKFFDKAYALVKSNKKKQDIQAWKARALYDWSPQRQPVAIQIFEELFQKNESHPEGLLGYCIAASDRGQEVQAMPHLLKAIVCAEQSKASKETRVRIGRHLARVLSRRNAPAEMLEMLNDVKSVTAVAFLARTARDNGAIDAAALFFKHCSAVNTFSASMAHNVSHCFELLADYESALKWSVKFLENQPSLSVGSLRAGAILEIIKDIDIKKDTILKSAQIWEPMTAELDWSWKFGPKSYANDQKEGALTTNQSKEDLAIRKRPYSDSELSLLSLHFTIVKILYVCGCLKPLTKLVDLIHKVKGKYDIHLTLVRNEHAYYSCIAYLMDSMTQKWCSPEAPNPSEMKPLYFCGDSHCLSPAWQTIQWKKETRLLVPKLVTGVKCWHMRRESNFYPSKNFENVVETIPKGSECIFLFGEIDCRESLLICVERGRYKSVEEGIRKVVGIYVERLTRLSQQRKLKIFVHPIPPVLDPTRLTVMKFNAILKKAVSANKCLHWLNFEEKLTSDTSFNYAYGLDGTHMHPGYVSLIENALKGFG